MYIREAHALDDPRTKHPVDDPEKGGPGAVKQPKTEAERHETAAKCVKNLGLTMPTLVDEMSNTTNRAYRAHPDRFYVIGGSGRIVFAGERGPWGFDPEAVDAALEKTLGA